MNEHRWDVKYETGIEQIDYQHKRLFIHLDDLTLALYAGRGKEEIGSVIDFLDQYAEEHFADEELLFKKSAYQEQTLHVRAHDGFRHLLRNFRNDFDRGSAGYLAIRVEKELRRWWESHILEMDMRYVPYVREYMD
jgi:hemerythrin